MTFKRLSSEVIQNAIGEDILKRMEVIAPILMGEDGDEASIYTKSTLVKLLESFGTAKLMKDSSFYRTYLSSLPESDLRIISDILGFSNTDDSYDDCLDRLTRKGWKSPESCSKICDAVLLPKDIIPSKKILLEKNEVVQSSRAPFKQLIEFQFLAMIKCAVIMENPRSRLVLQMPTGSGKTRTAMELIAKHLNSEKENARVLWLAHSEELCEQAIECIRETWEHLGTYDLKFGRLFGGCHATPSDEGGEIIISSFQSLYSLNKSNSLWSTSDYPISLIVVDEAHRVIAPTYKEATQKVISNNTKVLGLTATPGRGVEDEFGNAELSDFFFNTIVSLEDPGGGSAIEYLRKKKVLADVEQTLLKVPVGFELTKAEKRQLEKMLDYPKGLLTRIGKDDLRNLEILKKLKEILIKGKQCLFFSCSIEHSKFICALINYMGFTAKHIDGSTERNERRSAIENFKNKEVQVLCNYGVLATGFDAPKIDVVFISRPTKSIVLYSQMIGRGLRGPAIGGTEECIVVNIEDNFVGLPSNTEIFDFFEEYWRNDNN